VTTMPARALTGYDTTTLGESGAWGGVDPGDYLLSQPLTVSRSRE
jgi:hypothetical protein